MSTNSRPFFFNFLAAFRAHSGVQKVSPAATGAISGASLSSARGHQQAASASTSAASVSSSPQANSAPSASRTIAAKANTSGAQTAGAGATTVAVQQSSSHQFPPSRQHSTSPYSRSPASPGAFAASHHHHSSHNSTGRYHSASRYTTSSRQRRGSDSSSEGFRDTMGTEKWYIGGRTAAGEEKFYKLSMLKRPRSVDRLSLDRLSL